MPESPQPPFLHYVANTDTGTTDASAAFTELTRWWAEEAGMAHSRDLDRYGQSPDDGPSPRYEDYLRDTIAACTEFLTVCSMPLPLGLARHLAHKLHTSHPVINARDHIAGAIPICGSLIGHRLDLPLPEDTDRSDSWVHDAAAAAATATYPAETFDSVLTHHRYHDGRTARLRVDIHTQGTPSQHTGWAFFT